MITKVLCFKVQLWNPTVEVSAHGYGDCPDRTCYERSG